MTNVETTIKNYTIIYSLESCIINSVIINLKILSHESILIDII